MSDSCARWRPRRQVELAASCRQPDLWTRERWSTILIVGRLRKFRTVNSLRPSDGNKFIPSQRIINAQGKNDGKDASVFRQ